jgi:N-methylhydantoinase B
MLKLFDQGKANETLFAMIRANTRQPIDTEGDVYSLAACNDVGARRLVEMMDEFGIDSLDELGDHVIARSREAVLAEIAKLPQGHVAQQHDGRRLRRAGDAVLRRLTISDTGIHVDFSGTTGVSRRGINVPHAYTTAYTVFGWAAWSRRTSRTMPGRSNRSPCRRRRAASSTRPSRRRGLAPRDRPDAAGRGVRLPAPGRSGARAGGGDLVPVEHQRPRPCEGRRGRQLRLRHGHHFQWRHRRAADKDGLSATAYPSGVRGTPVEIAETQTPLLFWRKEFRPDSGGAGRTRGGLGQIMEIESGIDEPFDLLAAFDRIDYPARGRDGGGDGGAGVVAFKSGQTLKGKGFQLIPPGERLMILTPGGAGIGAPRDRDRAQVANDLADGLISAETAEKVYE